MCTVGHWKDGVMIEEWLFWDNATYMKQIGITQEAGDRSPEPLMKSDPADTV